MLVSLFLLHLVSMKRFIFYIWIRGETVLEKSFLKVIWVTLDAVVDLIPTASSPLKFSQITSRVSFLYRAPPPSVLNALQWFSYVLCTFDFLKCFFTIHRVIMSMHYLNLLLSYFFTKILHMITDSRIKGILHNCFNDSIIMGITTKWVNYLLQQLRKTKHEFLIILFSYNIAKNTFHSNNAKHKAWVSWIFGKYIYISIEKLTH